MSLNQLNAKNKMLILYSMYYDYYLQYIKSYLINFSILPIPIFINTKLKFLNLKSSFNQISFTKMFYFIFYFMYLDPSFIKIIHSNTLFYRHFTKRLRNTIIPNKTPVELSVDDP